MKQGEAGRSLLFLFDDYWWAVLMAIFAALLLSAYTHRKDPRCRGEKILRHDKAARISHWLNAAGILLLIYSGYMLGFLFFPRHVAGTEAAALMFNLHFAGAVLFLLGAVFWAGNMFLAPNRLVEHAPYRGSLKDAALHYLHMAGLTRKRGRPAGKYEASERLAFVPLTLLALFMGITGIVKMMAHVWHLPTWLTHAATLTHDYSTLVLVILLVFHIVLAAVVPWAWPLLRSMLDGCISVEFAKEHHSGWYEELVKRGVCSADGASEQNSDKEKGAADAKQ